MSIDITRTSVPTLPPFRIGWDTLPSGLKVYVRSNAQLYGRIVADENHWSYEIGERVEAESTRQMMSIKARTGKKPTSVVIGSEFTPRSAVS